MWPGEYEWRVIPWTHGENRYVDGRITVALKRLSTGWVLVPWSGTHSVRSL